MPVLVDATHTFAIQTRRDRALVSGITAFLWSVATLGLIFAEQQKPGIFVPAIWFCGLATFTCAIWTIKRTRELNRLKYLYEVLDFVNPDSSEEEIGPTVQRPSIEIVQGEVEDDYTQAKLKYEQRQEHMRTTKESYRNNG